MAERHALFAAALEAHLPGVAWQRGPASRSYWLTLPDHADARALAVAARRVGVLIEPGDVFFADPADGRRHVRLRVDAIRPGRIAEGIRRLGAVLRRMDHEARL
jgi:GntR family transcriptional regulator/MocR family aminotransferase